MEQNKENIITIDTDKAWNILLERLESNHLLTTDRTEYISGRKRIILFQRLVAVAAVCIGIIFAGFYFSQKKDLSKISLQNKENSGTLVTTLEDGSTVYLATDASISYPNAFTKAQRKVELNGNALFCVAKDKRRPFIVMINGMTIEVIGTIFAVQSSQEKPFELFVKQGKVNVHPGDNQNRISVEAGETVRLSNSRLIKSGITNSFVFDRYTEKICFKDEKLNNIVHAINTMYGFPTVITDESLNNRILTVTFEKNSVETMTELICMALNLEHINKQDTIFIRPFLK